ncbi:MAG: hypothetical protein CEO40_85 [Parcubacteria group bacterium LiPW_72]|nr:MAG: hypothetical protein CEO40_85 [Parcubacteria group bacterium LiPW_72]
MADLEKIALIREILEQAESNLSQAKKVLAEFLGGDVESSKPKISKKQILEKAQELASSTGKTRIIQGVFNGQSMVAPDDTEYPVPANYASKSKIIQGDTLKLTITEDGSFIYKQIGPVERKKVLGVLSQDDKGEYQVIVENKAYKVLLASVTYFKGEAGDEVTLVIPASKSESEWGAVENIIKKTSLKDIVEKKGNETAVPSAEVEKEVVPGQIVDDLDSELEGLEGLVDEEE